MTARKTNLKDPIYHDDDAARLHLETLLWPQGPVCPRCGVMEDRITKLQGQSTRPGVYKCKDCRKPFTVTVGTVMERSHIALSTWILAAHYMAASKKGMSALQLQRMIGTTSYETAWFLFHRLRECAKDYAKTPMGGEGKFVEADETFIGGKEKNKHVGKRNAKNIGGSGKQAVFTLVERNGRARSFHVANVTGRTLAPILLKNVHRSTALMTDDAGQYRKSVWSSPAMRRSTTAKTNMSVVTPTRTQRRDSSRS
jgi:transposase-like protein